MLESRYKPTSPGEGPFKTGDEPVKSALSRFVELDIQYPNQFVSFVLVANCDFYDAGESETNLVFALELIRSKPNKSFSGTMKVVLDEIRKAHKCKKQVVLDALKKVRLDGKVPKFEDMTASLISKTAQMRPEIIEYRAVEACVNALIERVLNASALTCDQPIRSHFVFASSPTDAAALAVISHKKIVASDVLSLVSQTFSPLLMPPSKGNLVIINTPTGHHIMEKKMAAGAISAPSISAAKDQQTSAEYVLQEWIARYGPETASQRRNQVNLLVDTRCAEAFDNTRSTRCHSAPRCLMK